MSRLWNAPLSLALSVVGMLLMGAEAHAQIDAEIDWRAPTGCPGADSVRGRVASLLTSETAQAAPLRARGQIVAAGEGYVLSLSVEVADHEARRSLRGTDCAALSEAGAWLIALAVDPSLIEKAAAPVLEEPKPDEQPERAEDRPESPDPYDAGPRRKGFRAGLFGGMRHAGLPALVGGLGVRLGLSLGSFYNELGFMHLFARELDLTLGARGRLSSDALRVRSCFEWGERVRFGPCAAASVSRTAGELSGAQSSSPGQAYWLTAGAALQVGLILRAPLEAMLDAGLDVSVSPRPRFEVEGLGTVATARFVSVHTSLGLGIRY